jgi:hypothetical protein
MGHILTEGQFDAPAESTVADGLGKEPRNRHDNDVTPQKFADLFVDENFVD